MSKQLVQFIVSKQKNIKHDMCPPCFTLFKIDPSKNSGLQYELHLKPHMLVELCASNYCTNDGHVNGVEGFFKVATKSHSTSKIWIQIFEPHNLTRHKNNKSKPIRKLSCQSKRFNFHHTKSARNTNCS